jgi:hypothetical protein
MLCLTPRYFVTPPLPTCVYTDHSRTSLFNVCLSQACSVFDVDAPLRYYDPGDDDDSSSSTGAWPFVMLLLLLFVAGITPILVRLSWQRAVAPAAPPVWLPPHALVAATVAGTVGVVIGVVTAYYIK